MRTVSVWVAAALVFGSGAMARGSVPSEVVPGIVADALEHFNLPPHFQALIADRKLIDAYQLTHYRVETAQRPVADPFMTVRNRNPVYVRTVVPQYTSDILAYWQALPDGVVPLRGFRAPILQQRRFGEDASPSLSSSESKHVAAAEWIVRRLAHDGLLLTLAHAIELLGPDVFVANAKQGMALLQQVGFPTDLLECFQLEGGPTAPMLIANRLLRGATPADLKSELAAVPFQFIGSAPRFQIATETGESELALLRMQVDGGYRDGIVPGGSIDVICQAVAALPNADAIISLPRDHLQPFEHMARNWRLRRTNHVTLIGSPLAAGAWAQDNGKAGFVAGADGQPKLATVTPRFASQDEGRSMFKKAESFVMEGLRSAGHEVLPSRLLFQGGSLLAVRDPKSGERILLVSEGEIHRNRCLGLTPEQIIQAFQTEFGVDRCVVVPGASYHLDFDVTVRTHGGRLVAFVNDTQAAAREIVAVGIDALERGGVLSVAGAAEAKSHLAAGRHTVLMRQLSEMLRKARGDRSTLPEALAKGFAVENADSTAGNLQTFLLALDLIETTLIGSNVAQDPERGAYLQALQRMLQRTEAQKECLRTLGWTVVAVPSMADLFRSVNYLNGIQHKSGYMMPVFGGLYAGMDRLAAASLQSVLGTEVRIQQIRSAECQRNHGGVHCTVAAYPKL